VPGAGPIQLKPAPDPRLSERGRYGGVLPKIGPERDRRRQPLHRVLGRRLADAEARDHERDAARHRPAPATR
jgi:hypothetical protein